MYQSNRGDYRTNKSAFKQFSGTCLGKIVIAASVVVLLLIISALTNPDEKKMRRENVDNIKQSILSRDSIEADWMDIVVSNIGHTFTTFKGEINKERMNLFKKYNTLEYFDHTFFSTAYIRNHYTSEYTRCAIGIFGMVIPLVDFNRFLLREGPLQEQPGKQLVQPSGNEEYFGDTPELEPFRNMYGE